MPSYWMIAVLVAVLMSGLSDISRIQKLEAQNHELLSRLVRLERAQPTLPKQNEDAAELEESAEDLEV
jgi:hypothetical protein